MVNSPRALVFNADPVGHPIRSPSIRAAWESSGGGANAGRSAWGTDSYIPKRVHVRVLCVVRLFVGGVVRFVRGRARAPSCLLAPQCYCDRLFCRVCKAALTEVNGLMLGSYVAVNAEH